MTEVSFAQAFLATLDSKPTKFSADHFEDPRTYPARQPYTLPRSQKAFSPPTPQPPPPSSSSPPSSLPSPPSSPPGITATFKSLRGAHPALDALRLPPQPPTTSVLELKRAVAAATGLPAGRVRLLVRKRPAADTKALRELLAAPGEAAVEFSVMVLGGGGGGGGKPAEEEKKEEVAAAAVVKQEAEAGDKHVAVGLSGTAVLQTEEFWTDLGGFLQQRIRDEKAAGEVAGVFRGAWQGR